MQNEISDQVEPKGSRFTPRQKKMMVIAAIIVIPLALIYAFRGHFVAAVVDGTPISRLQVIRELERQGGKTVLDALITDVLVDKKAQEKGVVVEQQEVDAEIEKIKTTVGEGFEEALAERGFTEASLRRNIETQLKMRKMLAEQIAVSEDEIDGYLTENAIELPDGGTEELRESIRQELEDKKFSQEAEGLILALKAEADITYYVNY